jgi:hypothetical protein
MTERMHLTLRYFSTSMLVSRPRLCISDEENGAIPPYSSEPGRADHSCSVQCVASARSMTNLLPNDPDVVYL